MEMGGGCLCVCVGGSVCLGTLVTVTLKWQHAAHTEHWILTNSPQAFQSPQLTCLEWTAILKRGKEGDGRPTDKCNSPFCGEYSGAEGQTCLHSGADWGGLRGRGVVPATEPWLEAAFITWWRAFPATAMPPAAPGLYWFLWIHSVARGQLPRLTAALALRTNILYMNFC